MSDDTNESIDGGTTDTGDAIGTGNDARVALLNSIANQSESDRAEELADINDRSEEHTSELQSH